MNNEHVIGQPVAVIGAGVSGISAAVKLASLGIPVILLEQRPYIGGRVRSFSYKDTGDEIDNGQHVLMGCYHAFISTLRLLGTHHLVTDQYGHSIAYRSADGRSAYLRKPAWLGRLSMAAGLVGLSLLNVRDKTAALKMMLRVQRHKILANGRTCLQLLQEEGQPPGVIRMLWEPLILATLNGTPGECDALVFLEVLRRAFLGTADDARLLMPRRGLSSLFATVPEYLAHRNSILYTSTAVQSLILTDSQVTHVVTANATIPVSGVICAIPAPAAARLLPKEIVQTKLAPFLENYKPSPIESVYLWYDEDWMQEPFVATPDSAIQWVFNRRKIDAVGMGGRYRGHVAVTISAAQDIVLDGQPNNAQLYDTELRKLFPEMKNAQLMEAVCIREKSATFLPTPGAIRTRPSAKTPVNNLLLAGDYVDNDLPATVEGAAINGITAAMIAAYPIH